MRRKDVLASPEDDEKLEQSGQLRKILDNPFVFE